MAKVADKTCQTSTEKVYLAFDCKLDFAFEQSLASRSAKRVTRSPRSNLWHPAVRTGARTPGGNCWQRIGNM